MKARVYLAGILAVVLVCLSLFWHARVVSDLWPLDRSPVGPNLVASVIQWAIVLIAASLLYPPLRKAIDRWLTRRLGEVHQEIHEHMHQANQELHDHLHHLTDQLGLERFEGKRPKNDQ